MGGNWCKTSLVGLKWFHVAGLQTQTFERIPSFIPIFCSLFQLAYLSAAAFSRGVAPPKPTKNDCQSSADSKKEVFIECPKF